MLVDHHPGKARDDFLEIDQPRHRACQQTDMTPLLLLVLASAPVEPLPADYETHSLHAFAALANDRIVDGSSYSDGNGVISAGLLFAAPSGFFANSELARLRGDGAIYPDAALLTLESAFGWQFAHAGNRFSLALLDYRLFHDDSHAHHGVALDFRRGGFALDLGMERDKPYARTYGPYPGFAEYDIRRAAISWTAELTTDVRWYVGAGAKRIEPFDGQQEFVTTGLVAERAGFEWQLGLTHASDDLAVVTGEETGETQLLFRVAKTFRLLP